MKRILALLIVGILALGGLGVVNAYESDLEQYKKELIFFSKPVIQEQETYVTIDILETNAKTSGANKPILPKVTKIYTFPFGTQINNVEVAFSETFEKEISKPIMPAPEPQIISTFHTSKTITAEEIVETYQDITIYPENRFSYRTGAGLKDEEHVVYLTIQVYPVQYSPSSNMIYYSEEANLKVTYTQPENPIMFPDEYKLLIITPAEFETEFNTINSDVGTSFLDYKIGHGVSTKLVNLDEVYNGEYFNTQGIDEQEQIKYFIKDAIENWGITYVLLVGGGIEGEETFPVRYAYIPSGRYEEKFPSDLYYADIYDSEMGFSDWDDDDDGKYAELTDMDNDMPAVDMFPDVYLGKLPCKDEIELQNVLNKILYYQKHNKMTKKIVQVGGDTFPGDPQKVNEGEFANMEVLEKLPGYENNANQLWASNGRLTKQEIAHGFNSFVDFVDFSGHGSSRSWATHAVQDEKTWLPPKTTLSPYTGWIDIDYDIFGVSNAQKYPVVMWNACSCHKYTESYKCIGWKNVHMKNAGSIASFGASGIGYGSYGTHETEAVMGWMEVHIFEELFNTKNLGQVWSNSVSGYINALFGSQEWGHADYKTVLELSMFGDPTLNIEDGEQPRIKSKILDKPIIQGLLEKLVEIFPGLERIFKLVIKII
jgi:hypothetical protein